ncbi:MAG: GIY-YIG nuclease family protein [Clostridia bacterium]|nr:GIY-YIG nuclease family protein [Clostridia bacterium]
MSNTFGYIYILTNPSFKEYVKIGYADDVEKRLKQLNRSECILFAFRVYATYEVDSRLSDKKIHSIIDKLNPNLRSIETFEGKERKREFYAMTPEDAYSILEAIAEINGRSDKLVKKELTQEELDAEEQAEEIEEEHREIRAPFRFSMIGIEPGEVIEFCSTASEYSGVTCKVINDRQVEYQGKIWSLSSLATKLCGSKWGVAGPRYFKYQGEWLNTLRDRIEQAENE